MATSPLKTYYGNCHCAAFKFSVKTPEIKNAKSCNCSICSKKGYLWIYLEKEVVEIERGEGSLTDYQFGNKVGSHKFCPVCGTPVMATMHSDGAMAINVRTFRDFDVWALDPRPNPAPPFDGAALSPPYVPAKFSGPDIRTEAEKKELELYTGGCHCGAVTVAVKSKPIPETYICEDDCSICIRNANMLIYPLTSSVAMHGTEHLQGYRFGVRESEHKFCRICGVPIGIVRLELSEEQKKEKMKDWSPEQLPAKLAELEDDMQRITINIRILDGVNLRNVKTDRLIESSRPPPYVVK